MLNIVLQLIFIFSIATSQEARSNLKQSRMIVNGVESDINAHKYQVSIHYYNRFICSGSLISGKHVLTAGHCTYQMSPIYYEIRAGSTDCCKDGVTSKIEKIYLHNKYKDDVLDNDIALMHLKEDLSQYFLTKPIKSIELINIDPEKNVPLKGSVAGWGRLSEKSPIQFVSKIRKTTVDILDKSTCKKLIPDIYHMSFCAINREDKADACGGDSGGPLVELISEKQIGIVSWGYGCARRNTPGVYTNVFKYTKWIKEKMKN